MTAAAAAALGRHGGRDTLLPRNPGGMAPGALLALLVHGGLVVALSIGVNWRLPPPDVVSAELWASVPQIAAPKAVEPELTPAPKPVEKAPPPLPAPTPTPAPAPMPRPALPDPQIAIEKAKKEKSQKVEHDRLEREKVEQAKKVREAQAREAEARENTERAAEDARLAKQREENLRRMMGQIASAGGASRGTAGKDAAPSAAYTGRLVNAIFPNIVFTETFTGNPAAEVEVRSAPNGTIMGRRIVTPSGNKEWDDAVLKAIDRTGTLPRDTDGRVPPTLTITFRPTKR